MGIEFHCSQCAKLIKAPDHAGGKRGKCPYCGHSAYIPLPPDPDEIIGIAPLSDDELRQEEELKRESAEYAAAIKHASGGATEAAPASDDSSVDLDGEIASFISAMHQSRLDEAEGAVKRIKSLGKQAKTQLKEMASSGNAPVVDDVPPPLAQAFVNNLLERIG